MSPTPHKKKKEATPKSSEKFSPQAKALIEKKNLYIDNQEIKGSLLETFKFKQFARNYVLLNGDYVEAFIRTYGPMDDFKQLVRSANEIMEKPEVQMELRDILPTDHNLNDILRGALEAPTPGMMRWSEKHQFLETAFKLKGFLQKDSPNTNVQVQVNNLIDDDRLQKIARRVINGNQQGERSPD